MRFFKIKKVRTIVLTLLILGLGMKTVSMILHVNQALIPQVEQMAKVEASRAATMIIQRSIASLNVNPSECMKFGRDENGELNEVNYDTQKMNQILSDCLDAAQTSLFAAAQGKEDPNTKTIAYDKGVIYSVHLGYFTGLALFSQLGPQIEIRMKVVNTCSGEIEVNTTAYGLNCTLLQIDLVITTQLLVTTPLIMTQAPVECRIPLVIQIVQGKLPDMIIN